MSRDIEFLRSVLLRLGVSDDKIRIVDMDAPGLRRPEFGKSNGLEITDNDGWSGICFYNVNGMSGSWHGFDFGGS